MTSQQTHSRSCTLQPFLEGLRAGDAIGHANLTLVPLRREGRGRLEYLLAAEAIQSGLLTVTEVSEGGSVPELLATNSADKAILLMDGEQLIGAKQNRILNTSVLLGARTRTKIPVSCVEQGRWHSVSAQFASGYHSPSHIRARKSHHVTENLVAAGQARSDQGAVWESVGSQLRASGATSPTSSLHDAYEQHADSLAAYTEALKYPQSACGVIVAIEGKFTAVDLFDQPRSLEQIWARLVSGYAMDAMMRRSAKETEPAKRFTSKGASAVLEHLATVGCRSCPTVGLGEDWRFEEQDILGQALIVPQDEAGAANGSAGQICVHLCAFPKETLGNGSSEGPAILPPSRRRIRREGD